MSNYPRKIKFVAHAVKWFDKANGNTYHSVRITRQSDGKTLVCSFTYGYGDSYRQTALEAMAAAKWLPIKYRAKHANGIGLCMNYERENNYPIEWHVVNGTKRDCTRNGEE